MQLERLHNGGMFRASAIAVAVLAAAAATLLISTRLPRSALVAPMPMSVTAGRATTQKYRCIDCHTILGNGATYAPDITRAWNRFAARAGGDEAVARASMMAFLQHPPNATVDRRQMPDFRMTPAEASAVVDYLRWTASR
jgi:mono/diheme cytochrome c family protein